MDEMSKQKVGQMMEATQTGPAFNFTMEKPAATLTPARLAHEASLLQATPLT